jgi:hypothetical protein
MKMSNQKGWVDPRAPFAGFILVVYVIFFFALIEEHMPRLLKALGIIVREPPNFSFEAYYGALFHSWQFWFSMASFVSLAIILFISKLFSFLVEIRREK